MPNPYLRFIRRTLRHKLFVFIECCKLGIPWAGLTHDLSKLFRPSEFFAYAEHHGRDGKKKPLSEKMRRTVWLHRKRNPHHWQFWLDVSNKGEIIPIKIGDRYLKEMVADMRGTGREFGNTAGEWYERNKRFIKMHPESRERLEGMLGVSTPEKTPSVLKFLRKVLSVLV